MTDTSQAFDPQQLWQAQPKAPAPVTLGEVRSRARRLRSDGLRSQIGSWVCLLAGAAAVGWRMRHVSSWMMQAGCVLLLAGALFCLLRWRRINSFGPLPDEGGALVAAYRSNLVRLRDARRSLAVWGIAPLAPGGVLLVLGRWTQRHTPGLPVALDHFIVLLATAMLAFALAAAYLWNQREADRLQRRLDQL